MPTETRTTWKLKACPKCGGDMYLEVYPVGDELHCKDCGFVNYIFTLGKRRQNTLRRKNKWLKK